MVSILGARHCTCTLSNSQNNRAGNTHWQCMRVLSPILQMRKVKLRKLPKVLEHESNRFDHVDRAYPLGH